MKDKKSNSGGIGCIGVTQIVFITLKLTGLISWSWIWVLSPIWISILVFVFILAVLVAVKIITD